MGTVTRYSHCLIIWFSIVTSCASEIRTFPPPVVIKISEPFESISLANPSNWTPFNITLTLNPVCVRQGMPSLNYINIRDLS